jgi:hypothetical protein
MSALTKKERDGLEDVFLSIHSHADKYRKIKEASVFVFYNKKRLKITNLFKQAKYGLKETKILHFLATLSKKKKKLSK